MNNMILSVFLFKIMFANIDPVIAQAIVISNTTSLKRIGDIVNIERRLLKPVSENLSAFTSIKGVECKNQLVDVNADGIWDQLLIEVDISGNSSDTIQLVWKAEDKLSGFDTLVNIRLSKRSENKLASPEINQVSRTRGFKQNISKPFYQMEGPGIENDKVAFRVFFDERNGKDVYGKIVSESILDKVGVTGSWHEMQYWGRDILRVGKSLGAGALAVKEADKIYPLGDADSSFFSVITEGPLKASFLLRFKNWDVGTTKKNGSETLSLEKGKFYYKNEIGLDLSKAQKLVVGMANFLDAASAKMIKLKYGFTAISSYGKQADGTNTHLGLAIMLNEGQYIQYATADTASAIPNTSYVEIRSAAKTCVYFFACWEKTDPRFSSRQGFEDYLKESADKITHPLIVKILNVPTNG